MDFVDRWSETTELPAKAFVGWLDISRAKFYDWKRRYGRVNEHNGKIPRDFWLESWERQAILDFHQRNPLEGYRRLTYMMIDADVVAVSPTSVYRVLAAAGRLDRWNPKTVTKGKGFRQPEAPHRHWHTDIAYVNLAGTFYYLVSLLDGYSRFLIHWELRESMTETDVEIVLQRARERYPEARPTIISDNGSAFIARDFKSFLRVAGMNHVRTSPNYPQSNGKMERWYRTLKADAIRRFQPASPDEARTVVSRFVDHYNHVRLHSSIGYVTPADMLAGNEGLIWKQRDEKLEDAREARRLRRQRLQPDESVAKATTESRSR
ncbi:MAG: IS3 family transposase [Acidimicrobiia bacterium]